MTSEITSEPTASSERRIERATGAIRTMSDDLPLLRAHYEPFQRPKTVRIKIAPARMPDAAETWFAENDPEGMAFEHEVKDRP